MRNKWIFAPILIFAVIIYMIITAITSTGGGRLQQVSKPLPYALEDELPTDGTYFINMFASWCVPCVMEHRIWMQRSDGLPVYGVAYKDAEGYQTWLNRFGDPYVKVLNDADGQVGLSLGVRGVPETLLVHNGWIIARFNNAITDVTYDKLQALVPGS